MSLLRVLQLVHFLSAIKLGCGDRVGFPNPFRLVVHEDEIQDVLGSGVAFNQSWLLREHTAKGLLELPAILPPPSFIKIYKYEDEYTTANSSSILDMARLGSIAAGIIENDLNTTGAILFRGVPAESAREFRAFFHATQWPEVHYVPFGPDREKMEGIDLATNIPPHYALGLHNEMAYSPNPASKIAFFCIQPAIVGGETILALNKQVTNTMSKTLLEYVRELGGVLYTRRHYDGTGDLGPDFSQMRLSSWQEKSRRATKDAAMQYFVDLGFDRSEMEFDDQGTLTIRFHHPGFLKNGNDDVWFNVIPSNIPTTPSGMPFPSDFMDQLELHYWHSASSFKLQKNDWLVLDNKRVMHGRLPYSKEGPERLLLTVYSA